MTFAMKHEDEDEDEDEEQETGIGKAAKAGVVWFSHHGDRKLRPGPGCTCQAEEARLDSV